MRTGSRLSAPRESELAAFEDCSLGILPGSALPAGYDEATPRSTRRSGDDLIYGPMDALLHSLAEQQSRHEASLSAMLSEQLRQLAGELSGAVAKAVRGSAHAASGAERSGFKGTDVQTLSVPLHVGSSDAVALPVVHGPPPFLAPMHNAWSFNTGEPATDSKGPNLATSGFRHSLQLPVAFDFDDTADERDVDGERARKSRKSHKRFSQVSYYSERHRASQVTAGSGEDPSVLSLFIIPPCIRRVASGLFGVSSKSLARKKSWTLEDDEIFEGEVELSRVRRWIRDIATDRRFEAVVALVIVINAAVLGFQADYAVQSLGADDPGWFVVSEYFFKVVFTLELTLRLIDEGGHFCWPTNRNLPWNLFDSLMVVSSWFEDICKLIIFNASANLSTLSVMRVLRLVRMFRLLRVMRFCAELRDMIQGILASLRPLIWCLVLLFMVMFTFGTCIMQVAAQRLKDQPNGDYELLIQYFGGLSRTVYTLYASITGGMDWRQASEVCGAIHSLLTVLFCMYIAFAVLCVLNIVTGVFVERAKSITGRDSENMIREQLMRQHKLVQDLRRIFAQMAGDIDAKLSRGDFLEFSKQRKVQAYLGSVGLKLQHGNAKAVFALIDQDNDGEITFEEFERGCLQLIGSATQLDLARMRRDNAKAVQITRELYHSVAAIASRLPYADHSQRPDVPPGPADEVRGTATHGGAAAVSGDR